MTDSIDKRLSKLQAKLKIPYDRIDKSAFQKRIENTKTKSCTRCLTRLFDKKMMFERKLYCEKCYNLKIKVDTVKEQPNMWEMITPIGE